MTWLTSSSPGTVTTTRSRLRNDQDRQLLRPAAEELGCGLGRGLFQRARVDDAERAGLRVRGERAAQRGLAALAVHLRREVAVVRRERHAAARPVRSAGRAGAGAAGALLAPRLRAAARDQAAALAAAGRRARIVQLGAHGLVDEVRLHLGAEDALLERDALRGTENLSLRRGHDPCPPLPPRTRSWARGRRP